MKLRILNKLIKTATLGITLLLIFSMIPSGMASEQVESTSTQSSEEYKIFLHSRQFIPAAGISPCVETKITTSSLERVHVLMQFQHIPDAAERKALEEAGVELLAYVHNNAWFVSMPSSGVVLEKATSSSTRWVGEILPEDKISPYIQENNFGDWAINPDGTVNLIVEFFGDVPLDDAEQIIERHDGVTNSRIRSINALVVTIPQAVIIELANEDGVQWIEQVSPPLVDELDQSRPLVGGDTIQAAPYNLNGYNVQVLVYDGGNVDNTHDDLQGRVTWGEVSANGIRDHATHVAGIIAGNGSINWNMRGMAPSAEIISYDNGGAWQYQNPGDLEDEYDEAINTYDVDIASNSWGTPVRAPNCVWMGDYNPTAQLLDAIVGGSLDKGITIVFSGGNERDDSDCGSDPGNINNNYNCTNPPKSAKNIITVGATNSDDDSMTSFSSWGPVDDGRIKPDVVAPGGQTGNAGIVSTMPDGVITDDFINGVCPWQVGLDGIDDFFSPYTNSNGPGGQAPACEDIWEGTSMACPHVSGSAALMLQDYRNTHNNADPWPSTIKALLMHTAVDLGNIGPDYQFGYGRINVQDAVDMIRDDAACCNVIIESNISANGEIDDYTIEVPAGTSELKVTLVWTDVPGTPNDGLKELVNDLDLIAIGPMTCHYPWVLNASDPSAPAFIGTDDINNVEQIVTNPMAGTWIIRVNGTTIPEPIQNYSLVSSLPMREEDMTDVEWAIEKGLCWLHETQNPDGSWSSDVGITSLAAICFLNAGYDETDPDVRDAIGYIRSKVQGDGSIWSGSKTYHTSLATLALVATHNASYDATINNAAQWLKDSQWDEDCLWGTVNKDSWYYGGFGYGYHVRPDNSNTQFALMALDSVSSVSKDDLLWDKAQVFLARTQNRQENVAIPDIGYEVIWNPTYNKYDDGGFVYYPGASLAGDVKSYGSMTGAGIWGLRLSNVEKDDPRVDAALDWVIDNYMMDGNPGMSNPGTFQYYYYLSMSKALTMTEPDFIGGHNWYQDLSDNLTALQKPEGYWINERDTWCWEDNKDLVTSYAILSLQTRTDLPPPVKRLSWMTFILHSNADLHVYDPLGRHVGMNYETGEIEIQIPNATYTSNGEQNITVPHLEAGNYRIVLVGTGTGEYTLNVTGGVGDDIVAEDSFTSAISEGEVHDADVNVAMITWLTIHVEEPDPVDAMVESATGTGNVSFVSDAGTIEDLAALNESDLPEENPNVDFPHGLFSFNITGLSNGATVNVTINFPQDIPTTAQYWKYNTSSGEWYQIPIGSNDGDNIITITLQDGGIGDNDGVENGIISDPGAPGVPSAQPTASSTSATGARRDTYRVDENVYTTGSGFTPSTNVDIHVVPDQDWNDGDPIPADVTGAVETVSVNNGDVGPVLVWHAPLTPGSYDIVIDAN